MGNKKKRRSLSTFAILIVVLLLDSKGYRKDLSGGSLLSASGSCDRHGAD